MPTASERALTEAAGWQRLAGHWGSQETPEVWADRPPREKDVVVFYDPREDLDKRVGDWGHRLPDHDLASLAQFAAALAGTEAEGWDSGAGDIATRAYEARRFLLGDRVLHWAVPWLDAVEQSSAKHRGHAQADRDFLLNLADEMRVAPAIPGREGLVAEGEDSFGPLDTNANQDAWVSSLWSGHLILGPTEDLATDYRAAATRWRAVAVRHPGSAQIWADLADRATTTAANLAG